MAVPAIVIVRIVIFQAIWSELVPNKHDLDLHISDIYRLLIVSI